MRPRRALVTGATGGLGLALVEALAVHGYAVRATGRRTDLAPRLKAQGAAFHPADLTTRQDLTPLLADIDVVFHAAALSSPWGAPAAFEAVNVGATDRLLHAARTAGCDAFVYVSTPSIYSEPRDRVGITEADPPAARPANAYVASKLKAEARVLAADAPGFATCAVRPRALVGPDDRVLLPRLLAVARRGWFPLLRGGRALVELTDVRDAADALLAADRRRALAAGRAVNVTGGAPRPAREVLERAFAALGVRPRLLDLPYAPVAAAAAMLEAACAALPGRPEPLATVYTLTTLAFSQTFDLTGAAQALDWRPRRSPEEAVERAAGEIRRASM